MTDSKPSKTIVYPDDIKARPAPRREVGAIAWIRENLFKTWLDIAMTLLGGALAIFAVVSFIGWAVNSANWWSISFNFRQYMLGRYESEYEWRIVLATVIAVFCCGMAVAMWIRKISRVALITSVTLLMLLFIVPTVAIALIPMPQTFVSMSADPIITGSAAEIPPPHIGFIGKAGEEITIQKVSDALQDDKTLSELAGFMDSATNLMRTAADNRLTTHAREAQLRDELARNEAGDIPIFTENQRAQRQAELDKIILEPPVIETFGIGQPTVTIEIIHDETQERVGEAVVLASVDDIARITLPKDGWYILRMTIADRDAGIVLLSLGGIYPIIRSTSLESSEEGEEAGGFTSTYIRMTDNFEVNTQIPQIDGDDAPFYNITTNQYRGARSFDTYLRVYFAPFLQKLSIGGLILIIAGTAGYWFAVVLKQTQSRKVANRMTSYAMIALPPVIWIMAAGLTIPELFNISVVVAGLLFVAFMFYTGNYLGRSPITLGMFILTALGIMALPQTVFVNQYGIGLLPFFNLFISVPALLAFLAGSATYGVSDSPIIRRNFFITGGLLIAFLIIPKLLLVSGTFDLAGDYSNWFLAASDQRRWGGLLLTMVLTIFGIIASFPIGVALALGRRSKLPVIKYGCTLYIELVRGSPFITVLFMMQLMIPLINPAFTQIPGTIRALVAVILFSAAYLAENVRGGLQSLPNGQTEAAKALGMSPWQVTLLITLPQALRAVIPALLGQFIALFKDTSLVAIVGLTDLTGFVSIMTVQAEFIGTRLEGLVFITLIYFVFSYVMAYVSRLLEASGSGSTRRVK